MIDLHNHTLASDGTYTPTEVIKMAKKNGVKIIAISDHDTVSGLEEGRRAAEQEGLTFINGVEFTTEYYGVEVHILGYFFDHENEEFVAKLKALREEREDRTKQMVENLKALNLNITYEDVLEEVTGKVISRMHIAKALMNKGLVYTKQEAFMNYIGTGRPAYVKSQILDPISATKMIKAAGGLVSIAHPKLIALDRKQLNDLLNELIPVGLDGIEAYYSSFSKADTEYYIKLAKERDMIVTGGSDFHGENRKHVKIGDVNVPNEVFEDMLKRLEENKNKIK